MREDFSKIADSLSQLKQQIQKKLEEYKNKLETTKKSASERIMGAQNADEILKISEELKEEAEKLRVVEDAIKQDETEEAGLIEENKSKIEDDHKEANKENSERDKAKQEALERLKSESEKQEADELDETRKSIEELVSTPDSENLTGENQETLEMKKLKNAEAIALNNELVRLKHGSFEQGLINGKKFKEILDNLTDEQIDKVAELGKDGNAENLLGLLKNFDNIPQLIKHPKITEAFTAYIKSGKMHLYDIDRMCDLPIDESMFNDPEVQEGITASVNDFISRQSGDDWKHTSPYVERVIKKSGINRAKVINYPR